VDVGVGCFVLVPPPPPHRILPPQRSLLCPRLYTILTFFRPYPLRFSVSSPCCKEFSKYTCESVRRKKVTTKMLGEPKRIHFAHLRRRCCRNILNFSGVPSLKEVGPCCCVLLPLPSPPYPPSTTIPPPPSPSITILTFVRPYPLSFSVSSVSRPCCESSRNAPALL
jgi:hypothetical protein